MRFYFSKNQGRDNWRLKVNFKDLSCRVEVYLETKE